MEDWEIEDATLNWKHSRLRKRIKQLVELGYKYETYIEPEDNIYVIITLEINKGNKTHYIDIYDVVEEDRESYMDYITDDIYSYRIVNKIIRTIIKTLGEENELYI